MVPCSPRWTTLLSPSEMGLEPIWISPFDFKSNAYTNSAIRASLSLLWRRRFAVRQSRPPNMAKKACFHLSWRRRPELNRCTRFGRPLCGNYPPLLPNEQRHVLVWHLRMPADGRLSLHAKFHIAPIVMSHFIIKNKNTPRIGVFSLLESISRWVATLAT